FFYHIVAGNRRHSGFGNPPGPKSLSRSGHSDQGKPQRRRPAPVEKSFSRIAHELWAVLAKLFIIIDVGFTTDPLEILMGRAGNGASLEKSGPPVYCVSPRTHKSTEPLQVEEQTMSAEKLNGADFKKELRAGQPKMGLFLNAHSPTIAEQLAHSGYDWLLVDTQHGPMGFEKLSAMLSGIASGGAKSLVRVGGYVERAGIQQALDLGAGGVLVPYINTADEARQAVSCTKYPRFGTRSVYFPQRSMNKAGLLGYAGNYNDDGMVALQVETASCIDNIAEIAAVPGLDI